MARIFPTRAERLGARRGRDSSVLETLAWLARRTLAVGGGDERLMRAFRNEERAGVMLAALVRTAIMLAMALNVLLTSSYSGAALAFNVAWPLAFAGLGVLQFDFARRRINPFWLKYAWVAIDCAAMTAFVIARNPFIVAPPPPSIILRDSTVLYYLVFLLQAAFTFSPRLVLFCGVCIGLSWGLVLVWVLAAPGVFYDMGLPDEAGIRSYAPRFANPFYVPLSKWLLEISAVVFLSAGLSIAVARSRRLVAQAASSERARSNLARHFSPNLVETLAGSDRPFEAVTRRNAAVLFADIRGFTSFAEAASPEDVVDLLRAFHALLEHEVFEHEGTLDKIMGDGLMASFGVPHRSPRDAARALACACAMIEALDRWNVERTGLGLEPIRIGIGVHYGPVVAGNVGSERRLAFEVIGDTVNTASRLQTLSKELGVRLVVSKALVDQATAEDPGGTASIVARLQAQGALAIRGRETPIDAFTLA